ncbi:MAG TPA: DUF5107 domain-containing protein [Saprospiraceae bacterium]|nr:DUF5107 domain-containing protein [Saprospiraceae bacterium]
MYGKTFIAYLLIQMGITVSGLSLLWAQKASIRVESMPIPTYGFGDPNPVAKMDVNYPYYHFDGYTKTSSAQNWQIVVLENEYIKVYVAPQIGGKVLGAFIKSSGKDFVYYNPVVKFRNIASRGPWTSGGIEFNFGSYGHTVNTATPVDYLTTSNADGSVSCFVGAPNRTGHTYWQIEIRLPADQASFETNGTWHNENDLPVLSYHWSNAAFDVASDLQVNYPGTHEIFHDGLPGPYPVNEQAIDLSYYRNNDFGGSHSYHVLGQATDFYGAYYPSENWGMVHWSPFADKLGKKIWYWSLARDGAIWVDLLTDPELGKGQYTELQSGLGYNQTLPSHSPFIVEDFAPMATEQFREHWYPIQGMRGLTFANETGALFAQVENGKLNVQFSPVEEGDYPVALFIAGRKAVGETLHLKPMEVHSWSLDAENEDFTIDINQGGLHYATSEEKEKILSRPLDGFRSDAAFATYLWGLQQLRAKDYHHARETLEQALAQDSTLVPAMNALSELHLKQMRYEEARHWIRKAMAWNTYDGEANYLFGVLSKTTAKDYDALDGFSVAAKDPAFAMPANLQMAKIHYTRGNFRQALDFAKRALRYDGLNATGRWLEAKALHRLNRNEEAEQVLEDLITEFPLFHLARVELHIINSSHPGAGLLDKVVTNEFIADTYLELALSYAELGEIGQAMEIVKPYRDNPLVALHMDGWSKKLGQNTQSYQTAFLLAPTDYVFPFRPETAVQLDRMLAYNDHWKLHYYRALIAWYMDNPIVARRHFDLCGSSADNAAFYLTRFDFDESQTGGAESDLMRAFKLLPDWRSYTALLDFYLKAGDAAAALKWAEEAYQKFPKDFRLTPSIVQAFLLNNQFEKAYQLLEETTILPFEGAHYGKALWDQATLNLSLDALKKGKNNQAVSWADKSLMWPENLGIGKPHDPEERLSNYLLYRALAAQGDKSTESFARKVYEAGWDQDQPSVLDILNWRVANDFGWAVHPDWLQKLDDQKDRPLNQWITAIMGGETGPINNSTARLMNNIPASRRWQIALMTKLLTATR